MTKLSKTTLIGIVALNVAAILVGVLLGYVLLRPWEKGPEEGSPEARFEQELEGRLQPGI